MQVVINYSSQLLLLLLLLTLLLLDHANAQTYVGSACSLSSGEGSCLPIKQCPSMYNDLLQGKQPEKMCGYDERRPIVCCPPANATAETTTIPPVEESTTEVVIDRPASRMCAQYAKSIYATVRSPTLIGGEEQLVNVSLATSGAQKLIVGGTRAEPREFPHMAAVGYNSGSSIRWDCGGTLISESFVLTAAHCTSSPQWGLAQWVRVGDLNLRLTTDNAQPQDRRIIQRIRHPNYQVPAQYNDIALLRLQQAVVFTAYVRPACLDVRGNQPAGQRALATGWGVVDWFDDVGSDDLLKVTIPIVAYQTCASFYTDDSNRLPNGINAQSQLCAGENGRDTCQGDSGGPLVIYSSSANCMYEVIGVTSFGQLCGSVSPGVYSRVRFYLSWIESVVWPNSG